MPNKIAKEVLKFSLEICKHAIHDACKEFLARKITEQLDRYDRNTSRRQSDNTEDDGTEPVSDDIY